MANFPEKISQHLLKLAHERRTKIVGANIDDRVSEGVSGGDGNGDSLGDTGSANYFDNQLTEQDPILRQFVLSAHEAIKHPDFTADPFGESQYNPLPGVFHKYRQRVLLTVSAQCAVHCRFCFRRWMPIKTPDWPATVAYLKAHPKVQEVVLSGGDPLMLPSKQLHEIMNYLQMVPQLRTVRIHSRLPIAQPAKCYDFPWREYPSLSKVLVIHCNHPHEISQETVQLCRQLSQGVLVDNGGGSGVNSVGANDANAGTDIGVSAGRVALFSQTVLLKGVNDRVRVLQELCWSLWRAGVQPYYLHLLDRVQGAAHFEVSPLRVSRLYALLQHYLPGYLIPKLVREEQDGKRYLSNR